jgi:photosystem II stability/assembly factor-like uncharacterized protein
VFDINIKDDTILAGTEWAFVWKSVDEAQTWTRRTDYLASANGNVIVRMGDDIFVASGRIYRSSDEGQNWQDKTNNLGQAYTWRRSGTNFTHTKTIKYTSLLTGVTLG